jgi:putative thioredoxin
MAIMTNPTPEPSISTRGAIDLSALNRPQSPPPGEPGGAPSAGGYVVDLTEENFAQVVQDSAQYPVVVLLWIPTDQANADLGTLLGRLAEEYAGRFLLGRVDAQASPQLAAAFQVQGVPTVVAVLQGQPVPLFAGAAPEEQIRAVLDQVLAAAEQNGVTGRAPAQGGQDEAPSGAAEEEAPEEPLPPLHQEAYDAIERDDLDSAVAAYERAIKQDPKDTLAVAGLAQVRLLQRTRAVDLQAVRAAAAAAPTDVDAQLAVADTDMLGGNVDDAMARLLDLLPGADADAKEKVRLRLLDYFEIVGPTDPRVGKARQRLAIALY